MSSTGGLWEWKQTLNQQFGPNTLFDLGGTAVAADSPGSMSWGSIMASYPVSMTPFQPYPGVTLR
jgi:hypothetical protein